VWNSAPIAPGPMRSGWASGPGTESDAGTGAAAGVTSGAPGR
jgi:hypothetical protein